MGRASMESTNCQSSSANLYCYQRLRDEKFPEIYLNETRTLHPFSIDVLLASLKPEKHAAVMQVDIEMMQLYVYCVWTSVGVSTMACLLACSMRCHKIETPQPSKITHLIAFLRQRSLLARSAALHKG
eukprot:4436663-Amphidinium_carterae.1